MVCCKINQTVIKIVSELKTRQSWYQMTTAGEQLNNLKVEIAALKEFILEQL